jgi:hypothetical protein
MNNNINMVPIKFQLFNVLKWLTNDLRRRAYVVSTIGPSSILPVMELHRPDGRGKAVVFVVDDPRSAPLMDSVFARYSVLMHSSDVLAFATFLEWIVAHHVNTNFHDVPARLVPSDGVFCAVLAAISTAQGVPFDAKTPFIPVQVGLIVAEMRRFMSGSIDYRIRGSDVFKAMVNAQHLNEVFGFNHNEMAAFLGEFVAVNNTNDGEDDHQLTHALLIMIRTSKSQERHLQAMAACHNASVIFQAIRMAGPRSCCRFGEDLLATFATECSNPVMADIIARHFVEHDMPKAAMLFGLPFGPRGNACIPVATAVARACGPYVTRLLMREQLKDPSSPKFARFFTDLTLFSVIMSVVRLLDPPF